MTNLDAIPWSDVVSVGIRTSADGPYCEDFFWMFVLRDGSFELPGSMVDSSTFDELTRRLPGLDFGKFIHATGSTRDRIFRVWHHEESRFAPKRDELAARFGALVARVGGDPAAASPVFDRLYAAWSAESRRYHNVEHLIDCLRELDGANARVPTADLVELALWYHDVVYEPRAGDCEERSARMLVLDAAALAIPLASAMDAAALVRATQHGALSDAARSVGADLVADIDLSILGRDVLRFMDYEFSVEEEYAPASTIRFRFARGRFLATLLDREPLFRTEHFHSRYEERARGHIRALLDSPRYRSYRWLRRVLVAA
jgi:predicted metal-dependent HD superfamily phosphohydrolase